MHVSADPTELHKHARQAESRQHVKQYMHLSNKTLQNYSLPVQQTKQYKTFYFIIKVKKSISIWKLSIYLYKADFYKVLFE